MELEEIRYDLNILYKKLHDRITKLDCYLFGSILANDKPANDIDILIIYEKPDDLNFIKDEFKSLLINAPYHISCFTFAEEHELNFIKEQKAEKIFGL